MTQQSEILSVLQQRANMSLSEIQREVNKARESWAWLDKSTISARVNELKKKGKVEEEVADRQCIVTGRMVRPVRAKQANVNN